MCVSPMFWHPNKHHARHSKIFEFNFLSLFTVSPALGVICATLFHFISILFLFVCWFHTWYFIQFLWCRWLLSTIQQHLRVQFIEVDDPVLRKLSGSVFNLYVWAFTVLTWFKWKASNNVCTKFPNDKKAVHLISYLVGSMPIRFYVALVFVE